MLLLRPGRTGLSTLSETGDAGRLSELRRTIARMQAPAVVLGAPGETLLGIPEIDRALGGGFAHGALHEIAACCETHIAAATGFALGVAVLSSRYLRGEPGEGGYRNVWTRSESSPDHLRSASLVDLSPQAGRGNGKSVVWVAEDMALIESGAPYGPGLDLYGLAPERLLTIAAARTGDLLWAMEEALHCRAVSVVIGEVRSAREIDLVATRRLSLAAAAYGAMALLLRTAPGTEASAAATRWVVGASPSPEGGRSEPRRGSGVGWLGIGLPRFDLALTRNRRGPLGSWMLEWRIVDASFVLATHLEPVARAPDDRPDRAHAA